MWKGRVFCCFWKGRVFCLCLVLHVCPVACPASYWTAGIWTLIMSRSQSSSSALSHLILLTVHVKTWTACFLSQHCPFFAQSPFGKYPTGPRSSVLLDLIGERHLGAASDWSDLAAAAAHINVCCFHSANMIRSIWTWYLVPPWPTLWL